jgi:hypothetical protein
MKALFFILLATAAYAESSNYALINGDGTVIEVFVASPEVATGYPEVAQSAFPDAVKCVPAGNAGMGWHYDATNKIFVAPPNQQIIDVSQPPPAFTLQDPTPVVTINTNPVVLTTNNSVLPIITTNNVQ